jgi:hypothetical protein
VSPEGATAAPLLERYEELHRLAELELELAGRGELDEMQTLSERWQTLRAALPEHPPREARALIERASLLHERSQLELLRLRETLLVELERVAKASRAAHGYAPAAARSRGTLDRRA